MASLAEIQRHVGVAADGVWGPATAAAIAKALGMGAPGAGVIGMINAALLRIVAPAVADPDRWAKAIREACASHQIDQVRRVAAFIAQMAHESAGFTRIDENLNYSAARLAQVWPGRFRDGHGQPNTLAKALERNPEGLANHVYANRMGNGPPESGDGWRFRGGGPLQITGRENWTAFAASVGLPLDEALAYGRTVEGGVMAAAWFWDARGLNLLADTPGVEDETRRINGGTVGLEDRRRLFDALVAELLRRGA